MLIHHDNGQYLYDTGLLQAVCDQLTANGIAHAELGGVLPNPRLSLVREGIELAKGKGLTSYWQSAAAVSLILPKPSDWGLSPKVMYGIILLERESRNTLCRLRFF